mmetsp:Transcript_17733/g.20096  ORF Transcript_17733/g.20096 Transcript_17733/m.20096 type:complete len:131 (-) Transcript_17733:286-678(-)
MIPIMENFRHILKKNGSIDVVVPASQSYNDSSSSNHHHHSDSDSDSTTTTTSNADDSNHNCSYLICNLGKTSRNMQSWVFSSDYEDIFDNPSVDIIIIIETTPTTTTTTHVRTLLLYFYIIGDNGTTGGR